MLATGVWRNLATAEGFNRANETKLGGPGRGLARTNRGNKMKKATAKEIREGTDYAAGWEVGRNSGRERIGRKLFNREAPEHIRSTARGDEWRRGYRAGLIDRRFDARAMVVYTAPGGTTEVQHRTGTRAGIVKALALSGVAGTVEIHRAGKVVKCGI